MLITTRPFSREKYFSLREIVGLVPTMGALHEGHLELVKQAKSRCNKVIVSIFVNPLQFNNEEDFKNYPSTLQHDLSLLEDHHVDVVFAPRISAIYPQGNVHLNFDTTPWDTLMEGKYRPGHFLGVAKVVYRLFEMIQPNLAFFGEKDFQQLHMVRKLSETFFPHIEIIGVPTVRSDRGVALSSRNLRLNDNELNALALIYQTLTDLISEFNKNHEQLENVAIQKMKHIGLTIEYVEIRSEKNFKRISEGGISPFRLFWAGYFRDVRLIDNLKID